LSDGNLTTLLEYRYVRKLSNKMIAEVIQNGIAFNMQNWNQGIPDVGNISESIDRLFDLLETRNTDYLLVGGIAILSYVEGRNTQDIDFVMSRQELASIPEIAVSQEDKDFAKAEFDGLRVDLLLTSNPLFDEVRREYASQVEISNRTIKIVSVEGLIVLKLYALPSLYSQGRFDRAVLYEGDITLLLLKYDVDMERILIKLIPHLIPSDLDEVRQIVGEIRDRINRRKRFQS
jgi:hypothetical protein